MGRAGCQAILIKRGSGLHRSVLIFIFHSRLIFLSLVASFGLDWPSRLVGGFRLSERILAGSRSTGRRAYPGIKADAGFGT